VTPLQGFSQVQTLVEVGHQLHVIANGGSDGMNGSQIVDRAITAKGAASAQ
jgi:hypothetical protein